MVRSFLGRREGGAALEAALLAPVVVALGFLLADVGQLMMEKRRADQFSFAVGQVLVAAAAGAEVDVEHIAFDVIAPKTLSPSQVSALRGSILQIRRMDDDLVVNWQVDAPNGGVEIDLDEIDGPDVNGGTALVVAVETPHDSLTQIPALSSYTLRSIVVHPQFSPLALGGV